MDQLILYFTLSHHQIALATADIDRAYGEYFGAKYDGRTNENYFCFRLFACSFFGLACALFFAFAFSAFVSIFRRVVIGGAAPLDWCWAPLEAGERRGWVGGILWGSGCNPLSGSYPREPRGYPSQSRFPRYLLVPILHLGNVHSQFFTPGT